ncbi:hypothetical protein ABT186_02145 [Streptomyces sp. NPDC001634]|uniref:hypothetical protein n=1 Tax=Streptomyces sp. NPDC001634 TaxID=3154390 RepID=UPI00332FCE73
MAGTFNITGDISHATARLKRVQWTAAANEWADHVGPRMQGAIRQAAPVAPVNGGRLRDATLWQRHTGPGMVRLEFRADNVPYVPYVLNPTRPHQIVPRNARVLRWTTPGGGSFFAHRVNHPGTRGNPYPTRAYHAMRSEIVTAFRAAIARQI